MDKLDIIEYYKEMIAFYTHQYDWYTNQIVRCSNLIKSETYDFGLSLDGVSYKKRRNRYYYHRKKCKVNIEKYVSLLANL